MMMMGSQGDAELRGCARSAEGEHCEDKHCAHASGVGVDVDSTARGAVNEYGRELAAVDREHGDEVEHEDHDHAFAR